MMKKRLLALILALSLLLSACGGGTAAATMHLRKTEGTVSVSDDAGKDVEPWENLGLYSGYEVDTSSESYAWIDLDDVKLTKMDQNSEITIAKEGKKLEIEVKSGSLFFNVTQPLADGESMTIRTSTMAVGIRGTCGWVVSHGKRGAQIFLLEGAVEAEATGTEETVQVTAGNMAVVTVNENKEAEITVQPFVEEHIASFVLAELENDDALCAAILEDSGLDVLNPPDPAERLRTEYLDIISSRPILDCYAANAYTANGVTYANEGLSYAVIVDFNGDGTDELVLVTQYGPWSLTKLEVYGESQGRAALYGEEDLAGHGVEIGWDDPYYNPSHFYLAESDGHLYAVVMHGIQDIQAAYVYTIENNELTLVKHTGHDEYIGDQYIANWDLTEGQNLCPTLPDDARMKNALMSCLDNSYEPYGNYYAKLADTDLYILEEIGSFVKCSWNGAEFEYTNLEDNIIYAKLMDMNQDGEEELILILEDQSSVVYSWKGTSCERIALHGALDENILQLYTGLYQDTVTGNVYLGCREWGIVGAGTEVSYTSLIERLDYDIHTRAIVSDHFDGRMYDELTPEEQEEANRLTTEAWESFQRETARFELVENIDLTNGRYPSFELLQYTVDEIRRQLTAR